MEIKNISSKGKLIFLVSILAISLVTLNVLQPVDARHSDEGFAIDLVAGTNQISFRDSSNSNPQTHSVSLDTSTGKAGFVTITVVEEDSNLDFISADVILASLTSTSSGNDETVVILTESGADTGIFSGQVPISSSPQPGKLHVGPRDTISAFYEPEHDGVGRFSAELRGVTTEATTLDFDDYTIDDPDGFNTRLIEACPYDLVTHPVQLQVPGEFIDNFGLINSPAFDASSEITVTISYANAVLDKPSGGEYLPTELELLWRPSLNGAIGGFFPFKDQDPPNDVLIVDEGAKTITGTWKTLVSPSFQGTLSGQYALGVKIDGCTGGS